VPFFCVSPSYAHVMTLAGFARELPAGQPVYALQPPLGGASAPRPNLNELIAEYAQAVRSVQPAGPYLLGGYSTAGLLAIELARSLRAEGQSVALVNLLDSTHTAGPTFWFFYRLLRGPLGAVLALLPRTTWRRLELAKGFFRDEGFFTTLAALNDYRPAPFDDPILLCLSRHGYVFNFEGSEQHWRAIARGGLDVLDMPVGHMQFLRPPYARVLAETLQERIDRALARECVSQPRSK
jgi:thioesterase domain-containing protein